MNSLGEGLPQALDTAVDVQGPRAMAQRESACLGSKRLDLGAAPEMDMVRAIKGGNGYSAPANSTKRNHPLLDSVLFF